ncbi:Protein of unknown function [Propionibacterium cyclohexanicum]|uniref:ATP-binding protein n=1 Tax=Propionibacterium cyclohexanicum TaxID=64702 RepID=A0A1H9RAZ3_9ACTN|nr:DUF3107 domain-containing protein [Propionibacterium cyclohexanicum]SER69916.1 Protein of unknown function [Propionibacterium cyclohexanicum]
MDIKIGIENIPRELTVETDQDRDQIKSSLDEALAEKSGLLTLTDTKGGQVIIPVAKIAYIQLGQEHARQVGFGTV